MKNAFVLKTAKLATMDADQAEPYGMIADGALVVSNGTIEWVGAAGELPAKFQGYETMDCGDDLITPALIDCHTHIIAGGNRANEFEMRLKGASYEEVARAGGGIVSTVKATRAASEETLLESALANVDALLGEGVGLIEVKSGYGLDRETEMKMLRVARMIPDHRDVRVTTSFLGAHAIPPEFENRADAYIDEICLPALEAAHEEGLVDCVDGFCESIAFSPAQIERVFAKAKDLSLPMKLHAEQLSNLGGAKLAASYDALSADHIEYLDEEGVIAMARANTCAVILPGAFYTLRETQAPPIDLLRKHHVPMAVATDCNPGSSPMTSLLLAMNMGCTLFRLTPEEALLGTTRNAARALGFSDTGALKHGMRADIAVWAVREPAELSYRIGFNPLKTRFFGGKIA